MANLCFFGLSKPNMCTIIHVYSYKMQPMWQAFSFIDKTTVWCRISYHPVLLSPNEWFISAIFRLIPSILDDVTHPNDFPLNIATSWRMRRAHFHSIFKDSLSPGIWHALEKMWTIVRPILYDISLTLWVLCYMPEANAFLIGFIFGNLSFPSVYSFQ